MIRLLAAITLMCLTAVPAMAADVMAVTTLERGRILSAGDIEIYPAAGEDPFAVRDRYVGKQLTRTVYAGREVTSIHLQEPRLVERNGSVTMTYRFGTLTIVTTGRSLGEGAMGDVVDVMNLESRKKVRAIVTGPEAVTVQ